MNQSYEKILPRIREAYRRDGAALLAQFLEEEELAALRRTLLAKRRERRDHPLRHSWETRPATKETQRIRAFLKSITKKEFRSTFYALSPGDYSLLHDALRPVDALAVLDLTPQWDESLGGHLGVEQERVALVPNALLLLEGPLRWWMKRVSRDARRPRTLLVFEAVTKKEPRR